MAYDVRDELLGSGDGEFGSNPNSLRAYLVVGSDPEDDNEGGALAAAYTAAPATLTDPISSVALPKLGATVESLGGLVWRVEVQYRPSSAKVVARPVAGAPNKHSFSTVGRTKRIQRSLETLSRAGRPGDNAPDLGGLINVNGERVEGVDVVAPAQTEQITRYLAPETVTPEFRAGLRDLTGSVNATSFMGYAAGEVLFLGAHGEQRESDGVWEVTYNFEIARNTPELVIDDLPAVWVDGHNYFWIRTEAHDEGGGVFLKPRHIYVEKVCPDADLSVLGI